MSFSINSFLDNMSSILDKHAPLKRFNGNKLKFKSKPWIQGRRNGFQSGGVIEHWQVLSATMVSRPEKNFEF